MSMSTRVIMKECHLSAKEWLKKHGLHTLSKEQLKSHCIKLWEKYPGNIEAKRRVNIIEMVGYVISENVNLAKMRMENARACVIDLDLVIISTIVDYILGSNDSNKKE